MNMSASTSQMRLALEKKKEFDRRVHALTKEFRELNAHNKLALTVEDFLAFFKANALMDYGKVSRIFQEFDETNSQQVTKYFFTD